MAHATLKLRPGVDVEETPTLNEAGISATNLIRQRYDRNGLGLIEKIGGWVRFFPNTIAAVVRALWAWEDTQAISHLAFGTQNIGLTSQAQLGVITNGTLKDITPRAQVHNLAPVAGTTAGQSIVTLTDAVVTNVTQYDSVYIPTHISVGGLILFGLYPCNPDGHSATTTFTIQALDALGSPIVAPSTSALPAVALFTTTSGSSSVQVTLNAHGYSVGDIYPVLVSTTVGGITLYSHYPVQTVIDANNFTITGGTSATSGTTGSINGGNARLIYSFGIGAIPAGTGFGVGGFGRGGFGTGTAITPSLGSPIGATDWTLDNWGEILLACPQGAADSVVPTSAPFQPIYQWDSEAGAPIATIIPQAPPVNEGIFVAMPERQIIAYGSTFTGIQDPLLVRWCDINDYSAWIGTVTNQAGSFRLPRGSRIVGGIQGPQQGLLWTDLGLWSMQYINQPLIYSFNEVGSGCGLIAKKAAASFSGAIYWMGPERFYVLSGEGVEPLPCPVWDAVFQQIDKNNLDKIRVAVNSGFGEVTWYYPTTSSNGEVSNYVKYNTLIAQQFGAGAAWDIGTLARSAWIDQSVLGPPIGADPSSLYLYQHETSNDADGLPLDASFRTGWFSLADGDVKTFLDQVWPDMRWGDYGGMQNATVNLTIYAVDYPGQTPRTYGPYPMTQSTTFFTPRIRARLVAFEFSSNDIGSFWRLGAMRYRFAADGKF